MKSKGKRPKKRLAHCQSRTSLTKLCVRRFESIDGVAASPMILFSLSIRSSRVRASKVAITYLHNQPYIGGSRPQVHYNDRREVIQNSSELWFVKVVCTLCAEPHSLDEWSDYLSKGLTPLIAFEVINRLNNPKLALKFFEFSRVGLKLNHTVGTYNYLLRSLCGMALYEEVNWVFDCMKSDGHLPDPWIMGVLVSSFADVGKLDTARKLLSQASFDGRGPNSFVYNKLLNTLVRQNRVAEAVGLFREQMALQSCLDTCTINILIRGLCRAGEVDHAFQFFKDMSSFGCFPDAITYNTLIDGYYRVNEIDRGFELFNELRSRDDISPDVVTYTTVILACCKLGKMDAAFSLYNDMISAGVRPTSVTFNVLINGFGKVGDMASALTMYEKLLFIGCAPDVVTFSSLIDGYCRLGQLNEALKLWQEMNDRHVSPNTYTFAIISNALCKENRLSEARGFLAQLKWRDTVVKPFMYNPVIDGLCKAGNVDEANAVVAEMEGRKCLPDKITFTILIIGHCMKGRMLEAIHIFNRMLAIKCEPDDITTNSFFSCLLKAGMASEAMEIKKQIALSWKGTPAQANLEIPMAV
ncbi:hypothetical protein Ancab_027572 [Ancistrocladus abbreviatus]